MKAQFIQAFVICLIISYTKNIFFLSNELMLVWLINNCYTVGVTATNCLWFNFNTNSLIPCLSHHFVRVCKQNVPKRIVIASAKNRNNQKNPQDNNQADEAVGNMNRNAAAVVAAKSVGRTLAAVSGVLNEDTGESYLKSSGIDRSMLRDGGGGAKRNDPLSSATTSTTEKYPMQWGYQVLPTLYSIFQKVLLAILYLTQH